MVEEKFGLWSNDILGKSTPLLYTRLCLWWFCIQSKYCLTMVSSSHMQWHSVTVWNTSFILIVFLNIAEYHKNSAILFNQQTAITTRCNCELIVLNTRCFIYTYTVAFHIDMPYFRGKLDKHLCLHGITLIPFNLEKGVTPGFLCCNFCCRHRAM